MPCDRHRSTCRETDDLLAYARRAAASGDRRVAEESVVRARGALKRLRAGLG
jgi:hypothetical protein